MLDLFCGGGADISSPCPNAGPLSVPFPCTPVAPNANTSPLAAVKPVTVAVAAAAGADVADDPVTDGGGGGGGNDAAVTGALFGGPGGAKSGGNRSGRTPTTRVLVVATESDGALSNVATRDARRFGDVRPVFRVDLARAASLAATVAATAAAERNGALLGGANRDARLGDVRPAFRVDLVFTAALAATVTAAAGSNGGLSSLLTRDVR